MATTSTSTTALPTTTTSTLALYQPQPLDEIDTGAATNIWFPQTEAEHVGFGDRHNYPPDQPGLVTLSLDDCLVDAPNRIIYSGAVTLTDADRATVGLHLTTFNSPVGISVPVQVEFTRSGTWTIPVDMSGGLSDEWWGIDPRWRRVSRCHVSLFWSDTETAPERFGAVGGGEASYVEFTFFFDGEDDELRRLGTGVEFSDWDHPARVWAYVNWHRLRVPFEEVWVPDPQHGIDIEFVNASNDGICRMLGINTELGQVVQRSDGCTGPLTEGTPTGDFARAGFEWFESEDEVSIVNPEFNLIVFGSSPDSLNELAKSLRLYSTTYIEGPPPEPDSIEALDRVVREAFARTDEVERVRTAYGDGYLIFAAGLTHVGESHEDWIRTYLARFDGVTWVLHQVDEEPWDTCGFARTADDGAGTYQVIIAGLESWTINVDGAAYEGFLFVTPATEAKSAQILDPSGATRCAVSLGG